MQFFASISISGLSACSDFLEEYSQDLAKVENWTDLDEVLLGEGYIHTGRFYIENGYAKSSCGDDFNILHLMSDEMIQTSAEPGQDMTGNSDQFAFITWQRDTGVDDEYRYRGGDEKYWNTLYTRINVCNMVIALIDEQPEKTPDDTAAKERIKGEAYFYEAYIILCLPTFIASLIIQPQPMPPAVCL